MVYQTKESLAVLPGLPPECGGSMQRHLLGNGLEGYLMLAAKSQEVHLAASLELTHSPSCRVEKEES